ncbi:MAG: NAD-dependent epimerase/dehydratase family protein [Polyangiaceae bacterium]
MILVTGGGGFLGAAIVRQLLARGDAVRVLARGAYPALADAGATMSRGDVASYERVMAATDGCAAVIHVAAKVGGWGSYEAFYDTNVVGTDNVLAACVARGIDRLVYTSTPSVVHRGEDLEGVDESTPYADRFTAHYPQTKAIAERRVLEANGRDGLSTVALRPHLIWGPGDPHLLPRTVARARAGKLRLLSGPPKHVDCVFVEDAAAAHVAALDALGPHASCAGKPYFISGDEPIESGELINRVLGAVGVPPVTRRVPPKLAYAAGWVAEKVYGALGRQEEPPITRFAAEQLMTSHFFDISAAERDLGWTPSVSFEDGLERLRRAHDDGYLA